MRISTCKLNFQQEQNLVLENRGDGVYAGIYNNVDKFATPSMTKVAFGVILSDFAAKRKAKDQGGKKEMIAFKSSTKVMRDTLFSSSDYVNSIALGNIDLIKLAGFDATWDPSKGKGKEVPSKETGLSLRRIQDANNELVSFCGTYPSDCRFLGILTEGFPLPEGFTISNTGKITLPLNVNFRIFQHLSTVGRIVWDELITAKTYYCYYFIFNAHGISVVSNEAKNTCG